MPIAQRVCFVVVVMILFTVPFPAGAQLPDELNPDDFDIPSVPTDDPDAVPPDIPPLPDDIPDVEPPDIPSLPDDDLNGDPPDIPLPPMENPADILAGRLEFASSPNPVGSGARAIGMGGAFIGVADDATAASWNPGGLVQLKTPEVSVVYAGVHRKENNHFPSDPTADGSESITESDLNYLSAVYPFNLLNRNMVVSLNYQHLYDFTRSWDFVRISSDTKDIEFEGIVVDTLTSETESRYRHHARGSLSALGLAYSIQIIPDLSFGLTVNIWDDDLTNSEWKSTDTVDIDHMVTAASVDMRERTHLLTKVTDEYAFEGMNVNVGALWRATNQLTVGMVFKSPFTADIEHERKLTILKDGETVSDIRSSSDEEMRMPMSYGIGLAWRESDRLTVSMDIFRTHWEDLEIEDENGDKTSPITNRSPGESDIDPTHQIRLGAEYLLIRPEVDYVIPLRLGLFYDPSPAAGAPDDYYGFSLGTGFGKGRFIFDLAYQFRYGNDVGGSLVGGSDFSQDVEEHLLYSSVIFHF